MAKSKGNFQQLLLQHGERIGLSVAGLLTVVLVVTSLFLPGSGVFSGSPEEKAKVLENTTMAVQNRLTDPTNVPSEADKPSKDSDKKLVALEMKPIDGDQYQLAQLAPVDNTGAQGRKVPTVLPIDDAMAKFNHVQVQSYIFDEQDPPRIYALEGPPAGAPGATSGSPATASSGPGPGMGSHLQHLARGGGNAAMLRLMLQARGAGGSGLAGLPGMTPLGEGETKRDRKVIPIPLNALEKRTNVTLAEQIRPLRLVVLGASFPFKQQVEEFRSKLGLRSAWDVLTETSTELGPERQVMSAFRFLGVRVERRELDGDGKPLGEFQPLDLNKDYVPYIILTGRRFEEDDREVQPLIIPGLVMPRLKQFRAEDVAKAAGPGGAMGSPGSPGSPPSSSPAPGSETGAPGSGTPAARSPDPEQDQYPAVEKELAAIKKTIETLKSKNVTAVAAAPMRFTGEGIDIFAPQPLGPAPGAPGSMPPGYSPGSTSGPMRPGTGSPSTGSGAPTVGPDGRPIEAPEPELPEHVLVRLIDVAVQPGHNYEYRLQVRMANPNYGRRDVASTTYAEKKELTSPWSQNPIRVSVPHETRYYAVDQKEVELADNPRAKYEGPYARASINKERQVVLQVHRWLDTVRLFTGAPIQVGAWTVAERIPVSRGEYVGRSERVELPVWRFTREEYVIASDATTGKFRPGIEVNFGFKAPGPQPEPILVDFEQGGIVYDRVLRRTEDNVEMKKVNDEAGATALVLNPDGRLLLLEGGLDVTDKDREETLRKVRKRIRDVKNNPKGGTGSGGTTSPFDT